MYLPSQSQQLFVFIYSLGLGFIIGIIYDILRGVRLSVSKGKIAVVVFDILFLIIAGLMTFLFSIAFTDGIIRFYILFGEFIGCVFYYFSFGIVAIKITNKFVSLLRALYLLIFKIISAPFKLLFNLVSLLKSKITAIFKKSDRNIKKIRKKHLPKARLYVYNLFGILFNNTKYVTKGGKSNGKISQEKKKRSSQQCD